MSCLNPDLNLLRVFDAVRVEQNLTRAASRLATTQPAVSNAVRRLRDRLGDELLIRSARGVKPTPRPCCAARSTWRSVFFGAVTQRDARSPAHGWLREHLQTIMLNETAGRVRLVR